MKIAFCFTKKVPFVLKIFILFILSSLLFPLSSIINFWKKLTKDKSKSLWHHHVSKLEFKNRHCLMRTGNGLILKLGDKIDYYIKKTFKSKICRTSLPGTNSRPPFNFGK